MPNPTLAEASPATKKRAQTVARLVEAANAVIAEKGFQRASLDEIAARAGLTKGAIYSNFSCKEDLFLAVVDSRPLRVTVPRSSGLSIQANFIAIGEAIAASLPNARANSAFAAEFLLYALTHEDMRLRWAERHAARFSNPAPEGVKDYLKSTGRPSYETYSVIIQALSLGFAFQHSLTPEIVTDAVVVAAFEALAGRPD